MVLRSLIRAVACIVAAGGGYLVWRRPWLRSGATSGECDATLPGDAILGAAHLQATRAVTIDATPAQVWPWLVQMGHGRAGWYSIDQWDNAGASSADRILSELQHLEVGDTIADATGPFGFTVAQLEPDRALVLRATIHPVTGRPIDPAVTDPQTRSYATAFLDFTWSFVLVPAGPDRTRLLIRVRYRHQRSAWVRAMVHGYELVDAVFTRRMRAGIRTRAEAAARGGQPAGALVSGSEVAQGRHIRRPSAIG